MTINQRTIKKIARNVRRLREEQELTQEQLVALTAAGGKVPLSRFVIQSLENGRAAPRRETLRRVADALGTTPAALRGETETPPLVEMTPDRAAKLQRLRELQAEQKRLERELGETGTHP